MGKIRMLRIEAGPVGAGVTELLQAENELKTFARLIGNGCEYVEPIKTWMDGVVLLTDEEAKIRKNEAGLKLNLWVSMGLFPGYLVGTVLIVAEKVTDDGEGKEFASLSLTQTVKLCSLLGIKKLTAATDIFIEEDRQEEAGQNQGQEAEGQDSNGQE